MAKGLFGIALEDMDVEAGDVAETSLDAVEAGQELVDDNRSIDEDIVAVEDAIEADGQLTEVADTLQSGVDSGAGVPESTARMTEVAVESIMLKLDAVGYGKKIVPACESFGSTNTRLQQTRIALEGVWDTIKSIWQKIKDTVKMIWTKIAEFFAKFFDNAEKMEKAAKSLQEEVRKASAFTQKEAKFKNKGIAKAFADKGVTTVASVNKVITNHENLLKGSADIYNHMNAVVVELGKMDTKEVGKFDGIKSLDAVVAVIPKFLGASISDNKVQGTNGLVEKTVYGPYVGNRVIKLEVSLNSKDSVASDLSLDFVEQEDKINEEVPTLSNQQMTEACNTVIALAKVVVEYKKEQARVKTIGDGLTKAADNIMKSIVAAHSDESVSAEVKEKLTAAKNAAKSVMSMVGRMSSLAPSAAVSAGNASLAYVRASLKQYEEKKAEAK